MPGEHLVILMMIGGVVSHDQMEKLLQVVFAITEYTYDVIVCYDGKVNGKIKLVLPKSISRFGRYG